MNYNKESLKKRLKENTDLVITTQTHIDKNGKVIHTGEYNATPKYKQNGWGAYYMKSLKWLLNELAGKKTVMQTWIWLTDKFKRDGTIKPFRQVDIVMDLKTNKATVSKAIKELQKLDAIHKIDGEWRFNPFIINVSGATDAQISKSQEIWEKEIGHYGSDETIKYNEGE